MAAAPIPPIPVARCADRQNPRKRGFVFWAPGASPLAKERAYLRRWRDKWLTRTEGCRCRAEARACRPPMAWLSRVKGREAPFPDNSGG